MNIRNVGNYPNSGNILPEGGGIHGSYEILCIQQGPAEVEWLGQHFAVTDYAVFLFPPHTPHTLKSSSPTLRYLYVEFDLSDAARFPSLPQLFQWNGSQVHAQSLLAVDALYLTTYHAFEQLAMRCAIDKSPLLIDALSHDLDKWMQLVRYFMESEQQNEARTGDNYDVQSRTVQALMRYMESNYRDHLTLEQLSGLVHLNGSYMIRLFKKVQGQTPYQYLTELRMNAATSYLRNTKLSIQDIALASGFNGIHYFSHAFKDKFGLSPSDWRHASHQGELYV